MSVKLDISREELYAYQAIHHFITKRGYQAVKVQNRNEDVWLVHPMEYAYPVICVSTLYGSFILFLATRLFSLSNLVQSKKYIDSLFGFK